MDVLARSRSGSSRYDRSNTDLVPLALFPALLTEIVQLILSECFYFLCKRSPRIAFEVVALLFGVLLSNVRSLSTASHFKKKKLGFVSDMCDRVASVSSLPSPGSGRLTSDPRTVECLPTFTACKNFKTSLMFSLSAVSCQQLPNTHTHAFPHTSRNLSCFGSAPFPRSLGTST